MIHHTSSSAYLSEAQRRAENDNKMRVHTGPKSVDLRINKVTVCRISTAYVGQHTIAEQMAKRYNTQPLLHDAADRALQYIGMMAEPGDEPAQAICKALREALDGAK